ncbi:hypothetical protein DFH11DRAFT_1549253 [Phellopilus nigrolimitatus]|nr:hypothetical protein DFH11DRAFT_1549253 [Phellopilus nigrolimitatus]
MTTDPNNTPLQTEVPDAEDERLTAAVQRMMTFSPEAIISVMDLALVVFVVCKHKHDMVLRRIGEGSLRSQQGQEQVEPQLRLTVSRIEENLKIAKDELAERTRREELESRLLAGTRNMKRMTQAMVANLEHEHDAMLRHIGKVSCEGQHVHPALLAQARWAEELLRSNTRSAAELASREEVEANAFARTREAVQLARSAVENVQHAHDEALQRIGEEQLNSPQGRAQVDPGLREEASKVEKDLAIAKDFHKSSVDVLELLMGLC